MSHCTDTAKWSTVGATYLNSCSQLLAYFSFPYESNSLLPILICPTDFSYQKHTFSVFLPKKPLRFVLICL